MHKLLILLSLTAAAGRCAALAQSVPSAHPRAVLVELFTSEGCSSCPPADALLRKLNGMHVEPNDLIVALSEHVTYWNNLGWRDPFSQQLYTDRQNGYGSRFRLDSVYTPQAVVNGERQVLGSDERAVAEAVRELDRSTPATVRIGETKLADGKLSFTYTLSGEAPGAEIYAVIADDVEMSSVPRGENAGRTLTHAAVARSLVRVGSAGQTGQQIVTIPVPQALPQSKAGRHLVVFAQNAGYGRVLSVDAKSI